MTAPTPEARSLFLQAADLAIRLQDDPANPAELRAVRQFIAGGPAHRAAWARVAAIHGLSGQMLAERQKGVLTRRNLLLAGMGGAAALYVLPDLLRDARADHVTGTAEQQQIGLSDGSRVILGPQSAIVTRIAADARRSRLLRGMAFFQIAPDPARPFTVSANGVEIRALGTGFDVSIDAGRVAVAVDHGRVQVGGHMLEAGDWLRLMPGGGAPADRGHRPPADIAAWRHGMLIADREPVAAMVARIARWQRGRVIIADAGLRAREVSGVFDLGDPTGALRALVRPFDGRVRQVTPFLTVISAI